MKKNHFKIVFYLIILFFLILPPIVRAQTQPTPTTPPSDLQLEINKNFLIIMGRLGFKIVDNPAIIIVQVIRLLLSIVGITFLILIIFAGIRWMTAAGNEEQITKAMSTIKNAGIGLLIIFAAYSITYTIFLLLERASNIQ